MPVFDRVGIPRLGLVYNVSVIQLAASFQPENKSKIYFEKTRHRTKMRKLEVTRHCPADIAIDGGTWLAVTNNNKSLVSTFYGVLLPSHFGRECVPHLAER